MAVPIFLCCLPRHLIFSAGCDPKLLVWITVRWDAVGECLRSCVSQIWRKGVRNRLRLSTRIATAATCNMRREVQAQAC